MLPLCSCVKFGQKSSTFVIVTGTQKQKILFCCTMTPSWLCEMWPDQMFKTRLKCSGFVFELKLNDFFWKILWKKCSRELWSPHSFVAVVCFLYLHAWLLSVCMYLCVVGSSFRECWNPCSCWWLKILLLRSVSTLHSVMAVMVMILLHFARVVDDAKCIVSTHICVCVCLSVCLSAAACPHYCTDPDVTSGSGRDAP